jgi:hypothetical protein
MREKRLTGYLEIGTQDCSCLRFCDVKSFTFAASKTDVAHHDPSRRNDLSNGPTQLVKQPNRTHAQMSHGEIIVVTDREAVWACATGKLNVKANPAGAPTAAQRDTPNGIRSCDSEIE